MFYKRIIQIGISEILLFLIQNAVAWTSPCKQNVNAHAPVPCDNDTSHVTTLAPETNDDEDVVGFSSPFYTVVIVVCVIALPITIVCRIICARRERNADRLAHLNHYAGSQATNGGVYSIEINDSLLISPPPYEQCVSRDSDKPPPYDAPPPYNPISDTRQSV